MTQPPYQPPYGQPPFGEPQYGQAPYGQAPYGQLSYGYQTAPPPVGPDGLIHVPGLGPVRVASMGRRLLARILDGALMLLVFGAVLALAIVGIVRSVHEVCDGVTCQDEPSGASVLGAVALFGVLVLAAFLYEWLTIAYRGHTLGKKWAGVKVVRLDTGAAPGPLKSFLRYIVLSATAQLCYVGYVSPFFDNTGRLQGWHDKAANVLVISTK
jgi:uncharacterized RDD family membrane protein YckC